MNSDIDSAPGSLQEQWLRDELAQNTETCVLAYFHEPPFSLRERNGHEAQVNLFQVLHDAGATVTLHGHNHFYERTHPLTADGAVDNENGLVSFVVGTGSRLGSDSMAMPTTAKALFGRAGLLQLRLEKGQYSWAFVDAASGESLDSGSRPCRRRQQS